MMKKAYIPALLALLSLLTLCGCHGSRGQNAFSVPDSFDESRQYEITFWAKNDTNKTQVDIYNKAITDFQALYPNISVKLRLYTDYGKIYNDVITNIATNTTPNVCITYPDHIATYLTGSNVVAPLDGLFADERYGWAAAPEVRRAGHGGDNPAVFGGVQLFRQPLRRAVHALHRGVLCEQDLCGGTGLHPARDADVGLCVGGFRGGGRGEERRRAPTPPTASRCCCPSSTSPRTT